MRTHERKIEKLFLAYWSKRITVHYYISGSHTECHVFKWICWFILESKHIWQLFNLFIHVHQFLLHISLDGDHSIPFHFISFHFSSFHFSSSHLIQSHSTSKICSLTKMHTDPIRQNTSNKTKRIPRKQKRTEKLSHHSKIESTGIVDSRTWPKERKSNESKSIDVGLAEGRITMIFHQRTIEKSWLMKWLTMMRVNDWISGLNLEWGVLK
jgi:hypothetical protein